MTKPFYYKQAADLKMNVLNFLPAHLHNNIEFSFQIFDKEQTNKLPGWRWGFSTFRIDAKNHLRPVPESKPHPEKGKKNITSHTHLTRNQAETTEGWLQQGYVYIHWKLLLSGDTPNHEWDVKKMKSAKGQPVMRPVYVGECPIKGHQRKRCCNEPWVFWAFYETTNVRLPSWQVKLKWWGCWRVCYLNCAWFTPLLTPALRNSLYRNVWSARFGEGAFGESNKWWRTQRRTIARTATKWRNATKTKWRGIYAGTNNKRRNKSSSKRKDKCNSHRRAT